MYAAVADTNEDYPGSCGRCYEVRQLAGMHKATGGQLHVLVISVSQGQRDSRQAGHGLLQGQALHHCK
jgi:hypothetical protein